MEGFDSLSAYRAMYRIRKIEEKIAEEYPKGDMKLPVHLSIGQEAAPVAICMALHPEDRLVAAHRSHAPYLAKGGDLRALVDELYGKATGCTGGVGGSMYLTDRNAGFVGSFAVVGDSVSVAIGISHALQMDNSERVSVCIFGDAVLETGQFWEALNFAALKKLPILFVCENNELATQTPIDMRQPLVSITARVRPWLPHSTYQISLSPLQNTDEISHYIYQAAEVALGNLPAFIEVQTYRFVEHVGPNPDLYIRPEELEWKKQFHDPVKNMERMLTKERRYMGDIITEHDLKKIWSDVEQEIRDVFQQVAISN